MSGANIVFSNPTGPPKSVGPVTQLFLRGKDLRETPNGPILRRARTPAGNPWVGVDLADSIGTRVATSCCRKTLVRVSGMVRFVASPA
jgi:hypothetical protein